MDFAEDIPIFMDAFGEAVTFTGPGSFFTVHGIFSVSDAPIIPMDGEKYKPQYTLTCAVADVTDITVLYTVEIRGVQYRILAVTPNPVTATTEILLARP